MHIISYLLSHLSGAVRIFSYSDSKLHYLRSLPTSGSRVLSLAYHLTQSRLFVGCTDGTIRCMEEDTGRAVFRMTGDVHTRLHTSHIHTLTVLSDSTVISGDSKGQLQLFDGVTGVYLAGFITHNADILSVVAGANEDCVYAAGIDGKVACLQRTGAGDWSYAHSHRVHSHDIYSLALCPKPAQAHFPGERWCLLSAGLDGKLCMYAAERHHFSACRPFSAHVLSFSQPVMAHSGDYSLLALAGRHHVDLWRSAAAGGGHLQSASSVLACTLTFQSAEHISSVHITSGRVLIVCTASAIKCYALSSDSGDAAQPLSYTKLSTFAEDRAAPLQCVHVQGEALMGYDAAAHELVLCELLPAAPSAPAAMRIAAHIPCAHAPSSDRLSERLSKSIKQIVLSADGKYLAAASAQDVITVYHVQRRAEHWAIQQPRRSPCDALFASLEGACCLAVLYNDNTLRLYDVDGLCLHRYMTSHAGVESLLSSEQYRFPLTRVTTQSLGQPGSEELVSDGKKRAKKSAKPASSQPASKQPQQRLVLYGGLYSVFLDFTSALPAAPKVVRNSISHIYNGHGHGQQRGLSKSVRFEESEGRAHKRQRSSSKRQRATSPDVPDALADSGLQDKGATVVELYRNVIHMGSLGDGGMVVVENPWARVNAQLPDAIARKRYMT
jgi:WD40 repeat protein